MDMDTDLTRVIPLERYFGLALTGDKVINGHLKIHVGSSVGS